MPDTAEVLDGLGLQFGTDKASNHHDYLRLYERRLHGFRDAEFTLIEVGVHHGGSVATWGHYFPRARIVGLDVNPACLALESGNVAIRIGDASDSAFLFDVVSEFGRPRVFIDDGSHRWDHQIATFQTMFPLLVPGGHYILEDLDTSFEGHLREARYNAYSSISAFDYLTKLARYLVADDRIGSEPPYDLFVNDHHRWVSSIEFARRTAVISKKPLKEHGPY